MDDTNKTMLTDLYQLTMNAAYVFNRKDDPATFDLYIRSLPEGWGYFIANGIEDAVDYVTSIRFTDDDIAYLAGQGFSESYLDFLKGFRFEGSIHAVREGTPVFPQEPLVRVTARRTQAQYVETTLLNIINFQTMIASKTSRVVNAAAPACVIDFGLRRAQEEDAGMKGARAAYLAGAIATSNVKAGKLYGIPVAGTHAHSFIMSFQNELDAFRAYVKTFPERPTLLIDTYDTVQGARNAAVIAAELEQEHKKLGAVRLDSGNLAELAKAVRSIFDAAGFGYVKIFASNDLNEYRIDELKNRSAPIDSYGVGTELITAKPVAAIPGVYKLAEDTQGAKIKLSEGKGTLPGKKQIYRQTDDRGIRTGDIIALADETIGGEPLLEPVIRDGARVRPRPTLTETRACCLEAVSRLPDRIKTVAAGDYPVALSPGLRALRERLAAHYG